MHFCSCIWGGGAGNAMVRSFWSYHVLRGDAYLPFRYIVYVTIQMGMEYGPIPHQTYSIWSHSNGHGVWFQTVGLTCMRSWTQSPEPKESNKNWNTLGLPPKKYSFMISLFLVPSLTGNYCGNSQLWSPRIGDKVLRILTVQFCFVSTFAPRPLSSSCFLCVFFLL